jgi:hypothetical protein
MNRLLILGILIISTAPLFAQAQQPNAAELAQKVVSIISGDKAKTQTYCQITDLGGQIGEANEEQDNKKAEALSRKVSELEKKLGPEYVIELISAPSGEFGSTSFKPLTSAHSRHSTIPVRMNSHRASIAEEMREETVTTAKAGRVSPYPPTPQAA